MTGLLHRHREQARSHKGSVVNTNPVHTCDPLWGASLLAVAISGEHDPFAPHLTETYAHQGHGTVADLEQRVIAHL